MAALIPEEKRPVLLDKNFFSAVKNAVGYHRETVIPSTANGVQLKIVQDCSSAAVP